MKTLLGLVILSVGLLNSLATLALYEPFDYAVADNTSIVGQTPALPGGTNDWRRGGSGAATTDPLIRPSLGLSVSGLYPSSGGALQIGGGNLNNARVPLGTTYSTVGSTIYYSLALKVTSLTGIGATAGGYLFGLNNVTASSTASFSTFLTRLYVTTNYSGWDGSSYRIGLSKNPSAGTAYSPPNPEFVDSVNRSTSDTIFIVGSWTFVTGANNDISKLWINPSLGGSEPSATLTASASPANTTDPATIVAFAIRQDANTPTVLIDELRIGDSWADVTPVPEPGTTVLALIGGLTILGFRRSRR